MNKENLSAQRDHCEHDHCDCGHEHRHDHDQCGCGHEHHHDHDQCGCGHGHHHHHDHGDGCNCGHDHNHEQDPAEARKELLTLGVGAALLIAGVLLKVLLPQIPWASTAVLLAAFGVVAAEILIQAMGNIRHGDIFGESFLMTIAGIGAVCIGEIPEGVMVFLLYRLGEYLQTKAVSSSRKSISALLDVRPDRANLLENGESREVEAESVAYVVCQHFGIDTSDYSMGYVAGWSRGKELAELKASLNVIHSTAGEIINAIQPPPPELTRDEPSQERGRKTDLRKSRKRK